jgi:phosphoenolpyruvate---glycerone phosphotransferase subunit DhaL
MLMTGDQKGNDQGMTGDLDLALLTGWVREFARVIGENAQLLSDLDAAIGDADHGINMDRGMTAVAASLDETPPVDMSALCKQVGMTLVKSVGGASGPLYGTFFLRMAGALGTGDGADAAEFAKALRAGVEGVVQRGRAEPGDKTMFDALAPALDALDAALASGSGLAAALADATIAAEKGRDATESMVARKGRASYLGQRSVGHVDPGATSAAMLIAAAASAFATGG